MIDYITIQKLRDLPIEGVAERLGLTVKHHKSLCPFHSDSIPSLTFDTRRNKYRCFVCEAHGSTIDLVMQTLNKSFVESCRWLADENNIIVEKYKSVKVQKMAEPTVDIHHLSTLMCQPYLRRSPTLSLRPTQNQTRGSESIRIVVDIFAGADEPRSERQLVQCALVAHSL